jgi:hypoxanthine phosphoribosyltransferase
MVATKVTRHFVRVTLIAVKTLLSEDQLREGVTRMASEVNQTYDGQPLTIIGVLTGSIVLLADCIRLMEMPLRLGVLQASSYRTGTTRSELQIADDFLPDIAGRHVLVVDDIYDTGHTLSKVIERLERFEPASIRTMVLLRKKARQEVYLEPDFLGFDIPDEFVVGYGLDFQDAYRNLPYLAVLEPQDLEAEQP